MKNFKTFVIKTILVLSLISPLLVVGQDSSYYYYNGQPISINVNNQYVYVLVDSSTFSSFPISISNTTPFTLNQLQGLGASQWGELNLGEGLNTAEYSEILSAVKSTAGVQYTAPYLQDNNNNTIGISNFFQIKLKTLADTTLLQNHASVKNFTILRQNKFMPKWYELSCNSSTTLTSLELCNFLYETGLYDDVDPAFMFDFSTDCTTDPLFPNQWGLNNTSSSGIDVNICNAWNISTGSGVNVAVVDQGISLNHVDLISNLNPLSYDTETSSSPSFAYGDHGTFVAGIVGAEKDNNLYVAGVAPDCDLMSVSNPLNTNVINIALKLANGINWSIQNGADIINNSWGDQGGTHYNLFHSAVLEASITNAITNGRGGKGAIVVFPSGNNAPVTDYPGNFNDEIALVGGIYSVGTRASYSGYGQKLDVVAPSDLIISTMALVGSGSGNGTSYAAPHYAGVAALMLSENPCLTGKQVRNIIESTSKKIRTDIYTYTNNISIRPNGAWNNEMGYGLIDAEQAVLVAQNASTTLDLYIKDRPEDDGISGGYNQYLPRANSPDIWVRNQPDGLTNQTHQNPEFTIGQPVYIYVRVRNKSCIDAIGGSEQVSLYWSKASSWSSWPQNWDGTQPTVGDLIGSQSFVSLPAGDEQILQYTWNILNPYFHQNWATCLLARIENSSVDPIIVYPNFLNNDVYYNNNIAQKNLAIVDFIDPSIYDYPQGKFMYIGNPTDQDQVYSLKFTVPEDIEGDPITDVAEIKIIFDEEGWDIIENYITPNDEIEIDAANKTIISRSESFQITNVPFPSNIRVPIYVGFSFLTDEIGEKKEFNYQVIQYLSADNSLLGSEHFTVVKPDRNDFDADAGNDKSIKKNETVTVSATDISENATYNWYDEAGNLVYTGKDLSVSPQMTEKYKLEVIATADGFKDYDEIIVEVKDCYIDNVSPNPASNDVMVVYKIENTTSAYIMVLNATATTNNNYIIDVNQLQTTLNVSNFQQGTYSVILVCDGLAVDMKTLIVQ